MKAGRKHTTLIRVKNSCVMAGSVLLALIGIFGSCTPGSDQPETIFEVLESDKTGLDFRNDLKYDQQFNLFKYIYFYNGSGIGAGDFNNDGLIDLFFGSNQSDDRLFLNTGNMRFRDVSEAAGIPHDGGWTTGISVVDINNDGWLDMYVCRVGQYETLKGKNQLLVSNGPDKNGIPTFTDRAQEFGLDFSGFSTQASFFDFDLDGDLDMFLLNHSVHENGTFRPRKDFLGTYHPLSGDRLYRNDGGKFTDITKECGINSSAIGYGLGIATADINLDGYPDIYIGNDFHEDDYLYINQKNGTFREEGRQHLMHTSQFSMGVDVADINNDISPEIISVDMLPEDPYILKRSLGEDAYDIFAHKINVGYSYQYTRNNLQYNRQNGLFSDVALYSGVAATDWSWAPLWVDFDNDGWKDLFISNGIPKRMNDIDYVNFVSTQEIQRNIGANSMKEKDLSLIKKFPEIKLPNKFYRNMRNLAFADEGAKIKGAEPAFSNGAVYADLDNDGDLDIVVNNIDAPVLVYENKQSGPGKRSSMSLQLQGPEANRNAIGARLILHSGMETRTYEKFPVRGFLSSMEIPLIAGLEGETIDSAFLIWPDNSFERISIPGDTANNVVIKAAYKKGLPAFDFASLSMKLKVLLPALSDITDSIGVDYRHVENRFVEFDREPLVPHMMSTEGPAIAVADINGDGREDFFIGGARNEKAAIYQQDATGRFVRQQSAVLDIDSIYEDVAATWADVNNDKFPDLIVASGGNEFYGQDPHNTPRVYLNNGKGGLSRLPGAFGQIYITASCVAPCDFDNDGHIDLFIGSRAIPWEYGKIPVSYLFRNDGTGHFQPVSPAVAPGLSNAGFVTSAAWADIDNDKDPDLIVSLEWGPVTAYLNNGGKFEKKVLTDKSGWWNFVKAVDIDNDGDLDLVAGNLGLNSRLKASDREPVQLYYNDFDDNGKKEQVMTYFLAGKEIPFANKAELEKQIPILKKKFLYAENFAKANLAELFGSAKLRDAELLRADYFSNALFLNKGNLQFECIPMPWQAQLSSLKDCAVVFANKDSLPDLLLFGNYYDNNIQMGRYDADFGTLLLNKGNGSFDYSKLGGAIITGQVRHISGIKTGNGKAFILARNNDPAKVIRFNGKD